MKKTLKEKLEKVLNEEEIEIGVEIIKTIIENPETNQKNYRGLHYQTIKNRIMNESNNRRYFLREFDRTWAILITSGIIRNRGDNYCINSEYTKQFYNK
jgi:hypothetical protein